MISAPANSNNGTADLRIIILAGGEGKRLGGLTGNLYGRAVPKQFAELLVGRSLLKDAVLRASALASPDRIYVVVSRAWESVTRRQLSAWPDINVIVQPENRGAAVGLLLPLAVVLEDAPEARVVVTPSDHYMARPELFLQAIEWAVAAASTSCLAVLGVVPDCAAAERSWLLPGASVEDDVYRVRGLVENPGIEKTANIQAAGGLWNTLVIAGRGACLWQAISASIPRIAATIAALCHQGALLDEIYRLLPSVNLGHAVFRSRDDLRVVRVHGLGWSDWDTPEDVFRSLRGTGHARRLIRRLERQSRSLSPVLLPGE
jgi:mannose-1-phosphate guanylyltransferase